MKDSGTPTNVQDSVAQAAALESGLYAAILPLVRLLARQAARDDYVRALEGARAKSYSTQGAHSTEES